MEFQRRRQDAREEGEVHRIMAIAKPQADAVRPSQNWPHVLDLRLETSQVDRAHAQNAGHHRHLQRDREPAAAGGRDLRAGAGCRHAGDRRQLARRHGQWCDEKHAAGPARALPAPRGQAGAGHRHDRRHEVRHRARLRPRAQHGRRLQPSSAVPARHARADGEAASRST